LVTHTTVGFGDIFPTSTKSKVVNSFHIIMVYLLLSGIVALR